MELSFSRTRWWSLVAAAVAAVLLAALVPPTRSAEAASPATFTTVSDTDGPAADTCQNGSPDVNCNIYAHKDYVWLNGGPEGAALPDGTYFFAIGEPGFQHDVEGPKLLSTNSRADRTFSVAGGVPTFSSQVDTSEEGLVRAQPYNDTTNTGGVYIAAICEDVTDPKPNDCKFDAFKVNATDPPPVELNAVLSGSKFLDVDGGGDDDTQTGIEGWAITIYDEYNDVLVDTVYTNAQGEWTATTPSVTEGTAESFLVCETPRTGWTQTGPTANAFSLAALLAANATVADAGTPNEMCYRIETDGAADATADSLNFYNIPAPTLSGTKRFDTDGDGTTNTGDLAIGQQWPIQIVNTADDSVCDVLTNINGDGTWDASSCGLTPGTYQVREVLPTNTAVWEQTGNTSDESVASNADVTLTSFVYTVTLNQYDQATDGLAEDYVVPSVTGLNFGNLCYVPTFPGGRTKGFWTNKNGEKSFKNDGGAWGNTTAANLAGLTALNLMRPPNKHGVAVPFDPTSYAEVKTFLNESNASDMRFMLSAQLTATWLNLYNGDRSTTMITPDPGYLVTWTVGTERTQTIAEWVDEANTLLLGDDRVLQGQIKDLLDAINNNRSLGTTGGASPAACAAPVWPATS